jgi:hypothetical protein
VFLPLAFSREKQDFQRFLEMIGYLSGLGNTVLTRLRDSSQYEAVRPIAGAILKRDVASLDPACLVPLMAPYVPDKDAKQVMDSLAGSFKYRYRGEPPRVKHKLLNLLDSLMAPGTRENETVASILACSVDAFADGAEEIRKGDTVFYTSYRSRSFMLRVATGEANVARFAKYGSVSAPRCIPKATHIVACSRHSAAVVQSSVQFMDDLVAGPIRDGNSRAVLDLCGKVADLAACLWKAGLSLHSSVTLADLGFEEDRAVILNPSALASSGDAESVPDHQGLISALQRQMPETRGLSKLRKGRA